MPRGDSISRYESYDLNNPIRVPRRNEGRLSNQAGNVRDTVETSKERGDRLSPPRIAPIDGNFSQDRLVYVGRAGRFVFMAICLPPYMVLYGMPKWLVVNIVPQLLNAMKVSASYGGTIGANIKDWFAQTLMKPFRNALGKINFAISEIAKGLASFLSNLKNTISSPFRLAFGAVSKAFESANTLKNALIKKTSPLLVSAKQFLSNALQEAANVSKNALKYPFVKAYEGLSQIGQILGNLSAQAQDAASNVSKRVEEITKGLYKKISSAAESLKEGPAKIQQFIAWIPAITVIPMINLFVQTSHNISEWGKLSLRRIKKSGKSLFNTRKKVKSALEGSKKFLSNLPKKARARVAKTIQWFKGPLPEYIQEEIPFLIDAYKFLKRGWAYLRSLFTALCEFLLRRINSVVMFIKKHYFKAKAIGNKLVALIKKGIVSALAFLKKGPRNLGLFFLQKLRSSASALKAIAGAFINLFKELHHEVRTWIS